MNNIKQKIILIQINTPKTANYIKRKMRDLINKITNLKIISYLGNITIRNKIMILISRRITKTFLIIKIKTLKIKEKKEVTII